eukprot:s1048_g17.t1
MGAGASAMPEMLKMIPEDQMEEAVKQIPPEAIELMKKMVAAAEEHQAKEKSSETSEAKEVSKESKESSGSKAYEAIKKIGNSDKASEMKRAIFIWDEKMAKEALKEICKDEVPEKANGAMLVMDQVEWADPADAKKWPEALMFCAWDWFTDQADTDVPFVPPEEAKENCAYMWDEKTTDAWLEKIGVKPVGKKGKDLIDNHGRSEAFPDMDEADKVLAKLKDLSIIFMKDIVRAS